MAILRVVINSRASSFCSINMLLNLLGFFFFFLIRDYMDRFLDENESAASSRASSPHNFTSRVRPTNGMSPIPIQCQTQQQQQQQQPVATQPVHTVAATTTAQTTVVTINVSNSNPVAVSSYRVGDIHDNITNRHMQQQSCVPTSVIVSGPDSGAEPPTKKLKIQVPSPRPKLISGMLSKPPPLKPIATSGSPAFHSSSLGTTSLLSGSVTNFNTSNSHEHSYLSVHNTPTSDSILFSQHK